MQPRPVTQNHTFYLSSLKCFEFCEDVGLTISQLPAKDAAFNQGDQMLDRPGDLFCI